MVEDTLEVLIPVALTSILSLAVWVFWLKERWGKARHIALTLWMVWLAGFAVVMGWLVWETGLHPIDLRVALAGIIVLGGQLAVYHFKLYLVYRQMHPQDGASSRSSQ